MRINVDDMIDLLVEGCKDTELLEIVDGIVSVLDMTMANKVKNMVDEHILKYQRVDSKCSVCGSEIIDGANFCIYCGKSTEPYSESEKISENGRFGWKEITIKKVKPFEVDKKEKPKLGMRVFVQESGYEVDYNEDFIIGAISESGGELWVGSSGEGVMVPWSSVGVMSYDGEVDTKYFVGDVVRVSDKERGSNET